MNMWIVLEQKSGVKLFFWDLGPSTIDFDHSWLGKPQVWAVLRKVMKEGNFQGSFKSTWKGMH